MTDDINTLTNRIIHSEKQDMKPKFYGVSENELRVKLNTLIIELLFSHWNEFQKTQRDDTATFRDFMEWVEVNVRK